MSEQWASVRHGTIAVDVSVPSPETVVSQGVRWGRLEAFATPAYWAYQIMARRILGATPQYRLGRSLREEIGVCLLGGHGIPASVGLAAFQTLRDAGMFRGSAPSEAQLHECLEQPLWVESRAVRYRFARQKARYLAEALHRLESSDLDALKGRMLRDALIRFPGIGYKTASWITRNWLDADDVAILDIHILRAGLLAGFFEGSLSVERHYLQLEDQFLTFSHGLGVRASELDAVIWAEMMASPYSVTHALSGLPTSTLKGKQGLVGRRPKKRGAHSHQLPLIS